MPSSKTLMTIFILAASMGACTESGVDASMSALEAQEVVVEIAADDFAVLACEEPEADELCPEILAATDSIADDREGTAASTHYPCECRCGQRVYVTWCIAGGLQNCEACCAKIGDGSCIDY